MSIFIALGMVLIFTTIGRNIEKKYGYNNWAKAFQIANTISFVTMLLSILGFIFTLSIGV